MSLEDTKHPRTQKKIEVITDCEFYCRPFQCLHVVPDTAFVTVGKCSSHDGSKSSTETKKG